VIELAFLLDGLRCSACHSGNTFWLDTVAGLVECRECGQGALLIPDDHDTDDHQDDYDEFGDSDGEEVYL
jgi:Zn ribbon nucleic-acid-binding protein